MNETMKMTSSSLFALCLFLCFSINGISITSCSDSSDKTLSQATSEGISEISCK